MLKKVNTIEPKRVCTQALDEGFAEGENTKDEFGNVSQIMSLLEIQKVINLISRKTTKTKTIIDSSQNPKKRKREEEQVNYSFSLPQDEITSQRASAQCLFCNVRYSNPLWVHSELQVYLKSRRENYQIESGQFFKKQQESLSKR